MINSLKWFILIMGVYVFLCTIFSTIMYVLYDICSDLYSLWEEHRK